MNDSGNGLGCIGTAIVIFLVVAFFAGNGFLISGEAEDSYDGLFMVIAIFGDTAIGMFALYKLCEFTSQQKEKRYNKNKEMYLNKIKMHIDNDNKLSQEIVNKINADLNDNELINKLLGLLEDASEEQNNIKSYYDQNNKIKYDLIKEQIKTLYNESDIDSYPSTYDGINKYRQNELDNILSNKQIYDRLSDSQTDLYEIKSEYKLILKQIESPKEHRKIITIKISYIVKACFFIIIPIVVYGFATMQWYNSVESYVHELVSKNISEYSLKKGSYFYKSGLETNFEILRINYYKNGNMIDVVPQLVLYANDKYVSSDEGSLVLREICDHYSIYSNDVPQNICDFGSVYFIANGTIIEPDENEEFVNRYGEHLYYSYSNSYDFIPYSGWFIPILIYIVIVILICRTKIRRIEER